MTDQLSDFGTKLKLARKRLNLTQSEHANQLSVTKETIYRYEKNLQEPTLQRLSDLSRVLDVSSDYLLGLDEDHRRLYINIGQLTDEQKQAIYNFASAFIK